MATLASVFISCKTQKSEETAATQFAIPTAFSGEMPCADCPGIIYTLILESSGYTEVSRYLNRSPMTFVQRGQWSANGDTLLLVAADGSTRSQLLFESGNLIMLDISSNKIRGELADRFVLDERPDIASIWEQRRQDFESGTLYRASGNEPFWGVSVQRSNRVLFREPGDSIRFESAMIRKESGKQVQISGKNETASFDLTLENRFCRDSMSGAPFSFRSTLILSVGDSTPDTLSGCGSDLKELYSSN